MAFTFPKIYPILDSAQIPQENRAEFLRRLGEGFTEAGATLLEYRNKSGSEAELIADAAVLRASMPAGTVKLILDDRAELVERIGFVGVHVDSGDAAPAEARRIVGPSRIVGTFGGGVAMLPGILSEPADYFSVGPVYATRTKQTTLPLIGIDGVRKLRAEAGPAAILVGVGGVTLENAAAILDAGASVVAVVGAIFRAADPVAEFRRWQAALG